jgi:hypothetical protein
MVKGREPGQILAVDVGSELQEQLDHLGVVAERGEVQR